jgi:Uma2 family endonuclease
MAIASQPQITLADYLALTKDSDTRYELVNGVLTEMGAESELNVLISSFLFATLLQFVPYYCIRRGTEIVVSSQRATTRYPDLMVVTEELVAAMAGSQRSIVMPDMPPPRLVIEIVSPGEPGDENYDRDYVEKPQEYAARGIPEYWLIDPHRQWVMVLTLNGESYQSQIFQGQALVISPTFPDLNVTAERFLRAGK